VQRRKRDESYRKHHCIEDAKGNKTLFQNWRLMMKTWMQALLALGITLALGHATAAQIGSGVANLQSIPAVAGHEQELSSAIRQQLKSLSPQADNMGNVWVTVGSGSPHRVIVTAIDEPGYVVSDITPDGYLRVQRLPQASPNSVFDTLHFAQPVWVETWSGKKLNGVFAGLSIHLAPGRLNPPKMNHPDEMYVDIGAKNAAEVRAAGVDLLDPVALQRSSFAIGQSGEAGPAMGDRFGCAALLALAERLKESKVDGTTTIAFVTQQWLGGRGLNRLLTEIPADEMIFVGRVPPQPVGMLQPAANPPKPGSGVLLGIPESSQQAADALADELKSLAEKEQIPLQTLAANPPRILSYAKVASLPERFAQLGIPTLFPVTPAETISSSDEGNLERLLESYLGIPKSNLGTGSGIGSGMELSTIAALTEAYGASGHEEAVRKVVLNRLPLWAQKKAVTDAAGNLVLHLGEEKKSAKSPSIVFVAHMDEIGYEVKKIEDDGELLVTVLGGGYTQYYSGHVVLVHKSDGSSVGGVLDLPQGWNKPAVAGQPGFEWPQSFRFMDEPVHVYVGTNSKAETEKLGIKEGDFITIPKKYRPLLGTMANARSFDDRVGDAALIQAVHALGPNLPGRDVTFVWSTREEVGLDGAAAYVEQAAKEGHVPDFVFAVDTFVTSDSPLETKRFGDAEVGKGFVVRAVDNSNIVPLNYVERVVKLARENKIPVQFGVTGGGNDGSVFTRYGSVDVALGWPLRYSHSPAEVIDTRDLDALGRIVTVLAKDW
jgi:putative aminopeptidase